MIRIHVPALKLTLEAEPGIHLMDLAQRHSIPLNSYCGGRGTCGKCRVKVKGQVSPLTVLEEKALSSSLMRPDERLACQVQVWGEVEVEILQAEWGKMEKALAGPSISYTRIDPGLWKWNLPRPDGFRTPSTSTWEILRRILEERGVENPTVDWQTLQQLRDEIWGCESWTLLLGGSRLLGIERGDTTHQLYGIAFDIGTTSVVGYLLDLHEGKQVALSSMLNPQAAFGADVISRISSATASPSGLRLLQEHVVAALNFLIRSAAASARIPPDRIYALSVVGNTTMHHLLLGLDPSGMGHLPYNPVLADAWEVSASGLGIDIFPQAPVFLLPNISGYVGADIVSGILFTGLHEREGIALAIDIGTNGEMVLGSRHAMLASSAAAGPAFEGAQISCGLRAEPGAISRVYWEEGKIGWKVVGEVLPRGLCGSGLVDLVALLLRLGMIDTGGRFQDPEALGTSVPPSIRRCMQKTEQGWQFVLAEGTQNSRSVTVTQRDVRELQLAKAAIRAGINILMDELGTDISGVEEIFLAGAFGNYIDPGNAQTIGLLPPYPLERIRPVGNAAGEGAKMALISRDAREEASRIARRVKFVELASRSDFQERFVEALAFPAPGDETGILVSTSAA